MEIIDVVRKCIKRKLSMKKKLLCYSKDEFEKVMNWSRWSDKTLPDDVAIISIGEPDDHSSKGHLFDNNHENVLNIDFYDIDLMEFYTIIAHQKDGKHISVHSSYERSYVESRDNDTNTTIVYECFNHKQAAQIIEFIEKNIGKDFYIHCHAGLSRSQAVVMFMLTHFNKYYDYTCLNTQNLPKIPNQWVLDCLNNVYIENKKEVLFNQHGLL